MTQAKLDDLLYRLDTCPDTLSYDELWAIETACKEHGLALSDHLRGKLLAEMVFGKFGR